jgi:hypothetical protein
MYCSMFNTLLEFAPGSVKCNVSCVTVWWGSFAILRTNALAPLLPSSLFLTLTRHILHFEVSKLPEMLDVRSTARSIEEIIGYVFTNKLLCAEAVQMASPQTAASYDAFHRLENNRRLSTLGHLTLKNFLCLAWYRAQNNRGKKSCWVIIQRVKKHNQAMHSLRLNGRRSTPSFSATTP